MRGKLYHSDTMQEFRRITPAYAGKTYMSVANSGASRDHPRVCGENFYPQQLMRVITGSPPRMRGKRQKKGYFFSAGGITPAYAGKTAKPPTEKLTKRDHPRVCGENQRI